MNEGTPVCMIQMSRNGEEALVGYDNGAWTKFSLKNGLVMSSSAPHEDFADIFKRVDRKKLSKYASTVPQCRSMIANDDLTKLYLASPVLRDSLVYAWDLATASDQAPSTPPPWIRAEGKFGLWWKAWGDGDSLPLSSDEEDELGDVERRDPLVVFEWEDESESWRVEVLVRAALGTLPSLFTFLRFGRSRTEPEEASGAGGRAAQRRPSIVRVCLLFGLRL